MKMNLQDFVNNSKEVGTCLLNLNNLYRRVLADIGLSHK